VALAVRPFMVTLVPERRQELTTEGGLDVAGQLKALQDTVERLRAGGMGVSLFVDPDPAQIDASRAAGAQMVELHTGRYADAEDEAARDREFQRIVRCGRHAADLGLEVHAGHGLDYRNVRRLLAVPEIAGFSIGHSIIARAVLVGMERAVREMVELVRG
jgi:pyridoxine 5-phosphate synthase